jgi:hypothetical protein
MEDWNSKNTITRYVEMRRRLRGQMRSAIRCSVFRCLISGGLSAQEPKVFLENPETLMVVTLTNGKPMEIKLFSFYVSSSNS